MRKVILISKKGTEANPIIGSGWVQVTLDPPVDKQRMNLHFRRSKHFGWGASFGAPPESAVPNNQILADWTSAPVSETLQVGASIKGSSEAVEALTVHCRTDPEHEFRVNMTHFVEGEAANQISLRRKQIAKLAQAGAIRMLGMAASAPEGARPFLLPGNPEGSKYEVDTPENFKDPEAALVQRSPFVMHFSAGITALFSRQDWQKFSGKVIRSMGGPATYSTEYLEFLQELREQALELAESGALPEADDRLESLEIEVALIREQLAALFGGAK